MNLILKDRNQNNLQLSNIDKLNQKVETLKALWQQNPTRGFKNKFISLLPSEVWSTLFTEGEISSRRSIERVFFKKNIVNETDTDKYYNSFFNAYSLALEKKQFSISGFFNIYSLLSQFGIDEEDRLQDGDTFRHDKVYIGSNALKNEYEGFPVEQVKEALTNLCTFLNEDDDLDLYIKSIVGHLYFEMIHPYFDYNGRTGRFIPLWLFNNHGRLEEMMYFSTAMGNYRESYLAAFKQAIDARTGKVQLSLFVGLVLDLLILNQRQYIWYKHFENQYLDKTGSDFNNIQKRFIWALMIKNEKQGNAEAWNTFDNDMKDYIESEIKQSQLAREINRLVDSGFVLKSNTKPIKYKLSGYQLFKDK